MTKPTAQIGFIKFVLIPMFETVMKVNWLCSDFRVQCETCNRYQIVTLLVLFGLQLFPQIEEVMVQPLRESRDRYEELKQIDDAMNEVSSEHLLVMF